MQILTSLLRLQSRKLPGQEMRAILRDSESRIRSMGLIHEKLYQSSSLSEIDFGAYVRTLISELRRMYGGAREGIEVRLDIGEVHLGLDTALPCGLIVNELVSNAIKHAFPGDREGRITVGMASLPEGGYELTVADDGVGLPSGAKLEREGSLGTRLVSMLVEQINGQLETRIGPGVSCRIRFRETEYRQRL